jgi:hypothetical protein
MARAMTLFVMGSQTAQRQDSEEAYAKSEEKN